MSGSAVFAVPLLAKRYEGITTELAITNLVPKPGFTDFVIFLYDQNGLVDQVCEKLGEKQVEYIDLAAWGAVPARFLGSAVVSAATGRQPRASSSGRNSAIGWVSTDSPTVRKSACRRSSTDSGRRATSGC